MHRRGMVASLAALGLVACAPPRETQQVATPDRPQTGPIAPPVVSDRWFNTEPIAWGSLRGRVVMTEFWTFGCYNCRNVIPALKGYHATFASRGFVLIGVHTPEFEYEKEPGAVQAAIAQHGIAYAVAMDNAMQIWRAYRNRYWPARYLVDKRGVIRYTHYGEGAYEQTARAIMALLDEPA